MATCLFVVYDRTIAPDGPAGGSGVNYARLRSLAELGHDVHLWHYAYENGRRSFDAYYSAHPQQWQEVQSMCASVVLSTYSERSSMAARVANRVMNNVRHDAVANPAVRFKAGRDFRRLLHRVGPDLVWAENLGPSQVASLHHGAPLVYSHHDWRYRVRAEHRSATTATDASQREEEERTALSAAAVVTGSAVDRSELEDLGCANTHYIPVGYMEGGAVAERSEHRRPDIVHLGSLSTTASRVGLTAFVETVVPDLGSAVELVTIIGDTSAAPDTLAARLVGLRCLGYVDDLSSVLHPYDVHVIPWDRPTGQRTRAVAALRHRQVVVAVRAGVSCFPELVDGVNCRLVDRIEDMATTISELLDDDAQRHSLGDKAAETYESSFTIGALLPRYTAVVDSVVT